MQAPSIPVQFARPIPTVSTQAPANFLNRPGPYGAQPQGAPRVGGAAVLPPAAAIPAAGTVAAGAGSSLVLPAAVLAIPLAIGAGETGQPILSTASENEAIRRADRARAQEHPGSDNPGLDRSGNANPSNTPGGYRRPNVNTRPRPAPGVGIIYKVDFIGEQISPDYQILTSSYFNLTGPIGSPVNLPKAGQPGTVDMGIPSGDGFKPVITAGTNNVKNYRVRITNITRVGLPPNPPAPGQENSPPATATPPLTFPPNPTQPNTPPNPTQPNDPNNPTQPAQPTNPTIQNPVNPGPLVRGPFAPPPPGTITPPLPAPLTPVSPVPNGPNNPKRLPCVDPCADLQADRMSPVVIQADVFVSCTRNRFGLLIPYDSIPVVVPKAFSEAFRLMFHNQAELLKTISCQPPAEAIAAIPDWWAVRLGANRPQLLILYAIKFKDGTWDKPKYVLSIPHWNKSKADTVIANFPSYAKGDFYGIRVLPDNSKLIVNAVSADEARRVLTKLSESIPNDMIQNSQTSISDRKGAPLNKVTVYPRIARFYQTGQKNLSPDWTVDFR